ncbi:hypothetical protein [Fulvimarina sp. MAC8]|uniref:hypothetical protein n=1 Tax=Fulvimarina sp. MAC8 TaxID=3162874 RepID=UPI0032EDD03C
MSETIRFEHPDHGTYGSPAAVAADANLSVAEKKTILHEWKQSLEQVLKDDPHAEGAKDTRAQIDAAEGTFV